MTNERLRQLVRAELPTGHEWEVTFPEGSRAVMRITPQGDPETCWSVVCMSEGEAWNIRTFMTGMSLAQILPGIEAWAAQAATVN